MKQGQCRIVPYVCTQLAWTLASTLGLAAAVAFGGASAISAQDTPPLPERLLVPAPAEPSETGGAGQLLRPPAVAGLFYPKDPAELSKTIDSLLQAAQPKALPSPNLRALICPHAGYVYSGPTAAAGYKLVAGRSYRTVVVLAPSHYALLKGAYVPEIDGYETPLGKVGISEKAKRLSKMSPFTSEPGARVERPGWWPQSSRRAPARGEDTPDTWEHSGEVQVPFLQKVLKDFTLIPVVMGDTDAEQAARVLAENLDLDGSTLLIASSDLSHYHPYDEARNLDARCVKAICDLDIDRLKGEEACGKLPILTLLHVAKKKGWKAMLLDHRNSGDTAGDKDRVVGYAAVAFYAPTEEAYSRQERKALLELARKTVREAVAHNRLPEVDPTTFAGKLSEKRACFVTLTKRGALRGCIGHIVAQEPLYRAVIDNARSAAQRDYRFSPVQLDEVPQLEIEVSVLTDPKPLAFDSPEDLLNKLLPGRDGVILEIGNRRATYLPQVWEHLSDKVAFLNSLAQKAGCEAPAWRQPGVSVSTYQVQAFKESEL